jgi:hypothetical protein
MQKLEVAINGLQKAKDANTASLTVVHEEGHNQLHVGFMTGTGENYRKVDDAQVSVWFTEGKEKMIWEGDFAALKEALFTKGYPTVITGTYNQPFTIQAIFKDVIFYGNEQESDENANVIIFNRKMELLSNNYHAANELTIMAEKNEGLEWASAAFLHYQEKQYGYKVDLLLAYKG